MVRPWRGPSYPLPILLSPRSRVQSPDERLELRRAVSISFPALMAVAEVAIEILPQQQQQPPPPPPPREPAVAPPNLSVPRVLQYLYLLSAWVACAGVAAGTVARRALGDSSPLVYGFLKVSIGALVFPALLILVFALRVLRAMLAVGFRRSLRTHAREIQIQATKVLDWVLVLRDIYTSSL